MATVQETASLRRSDSLEHTRAEAFNHQEIVTEYFQLLRNTMTANNLETRPRQIYNCDKTFLPMDYTRERVVAAKGSKNVYSLTTGTTDHISLLCCASAAGLPLPPMIIYAKSFPGGPYRLNGPDDALHDKSDSGWIDTELFMTWLKKDFFEACGNTATSTFACRQAQISQLLMCVKRIM